MDPDEAVRAASERIEAWCAENPARDWPAEWVFERGRFGPSFGDPIKVTYEPAAYRVWPYAYHYSTQLGTSYHWYWTCHRCGHTTKDLIPTREQAVSDAESHVAGCADEAQSRYEG